MPSKKRQQEHEIVKLWNEANKSKWENDVEKLIFIFIQTKVHYVITKEGAFPPFDGDDDIC